MDRRSFLDAIALLPFVGKIVHLRQLKEPQWLDADIGWQRRGAWLCYDYNCCAVSSSSNDVTKICRCECCHKIRKCRQIWYRRLKPLRCRTVAAGDWHDPNVWEHHRVPREVDHAILEHDITVTKPGTFFAPDTLTLGTESSFRIVNDCVVEFMNREELCPHPHLR